MGKRDKKTFKGTPTKPRLSIYRSNNHIYAQAIDDSSSITILSCSTLEKEVKEKVGNTATKIASRVVGQIIGERLLQNNINQITFDRGKRPYHGRIKELAEGARVAGVIF